MALLVANSSILYRKFNEDQNQQINGYYPFPVNGNVFLSIDYRRKEKRINRIGSIEETSWQGVSRSVEGEMEAITGMEHLDQILNQAQEQHQIIVIDWMAAWCRKCIYLKPKLERLAAEYHPDVKFYMVDVNNVSQAMVKRGNISKMPTIQLWKNKELKAEVIGAHKGWVVVDEVREMIEKNL